MIAQRTVNGPITDPLCAYSALKSRWLREVGQMPWGTGAQPPSAKMRPRHPRVNKPVFAHANGTAYDTGDMRRIAQRMAAACGEDPERFGGKSFRSGGATDLRCALGAAEGKAVIKQRGRWSSDIADIYQRALVLDQLNGSAAMSSASGVDLEGLLDGWSQPAN